MPRKKPDLLSFQEAPTKVNVTLRESNLLGGDGKSSLYGSVNHRKVTVKSILKEMEYNHASIASKELLFYLAQELSERMMYKLRHGYAVELLDFGTIFPTMKGSIKKTDTPGNIASHFEVGFTPSKEAREAVKSLEVANVVAVREQHAVYLVRELMAADSPRNLIKIGRMAQIKGKGLKMGGDVSGLYAAKISGEWSGNIPPRSEWIKLSNISANLPSKIEFFVDKMEAGTYVFIVETSLSAGGKPLKKSVVFNSGIVKAVALGADFGPAVATAGN